MNREQLLKKRSDLIREMKDLDAQISREFSQEKHDAFVAKKDDVATIDAQLARMDALAELERSADTTKNAPAKGDQEEDGSAATPPPAAPASASATTETQRCAGIVEICRQFGMDDQIHGYIEKNASVEDVRRDVLTKLAKDYSPVASASRAAVGEENVDKFRNQASDALILRSGLNISMVSRDGSYKAADGAQKLRHLGLHGLMREYAQLRGASNANRLTVDELRRSVFTPDSQFAAMLDNTVNKSMAIGYGDAGATFDMWTRPGSNPDFKPTRKYRLSEAGTPSKILQNGEFAHDQMTDERVQLQLETYGITFTLSRQAIINDDMDYLTKMPAAYVRGFRRLINRNVYAILNNNTNYQVDTTALFHSTHGNLAGSASYPTTTALSLARAAMRKHTNLRGEEKLNIVPRFIVAGVDLETPFEKLLESGSDPAGTNSGVINPMRGKFTLITDPELTSATSTYPDWFLAADPAMCDTIEVAYLNGNSSPTVESQMSFEYLGMAWRIFGDWDIDILDYRGLYKVPGAAAA